MTMPKDCCRKGNGPRVSKNENSKIYDAWKEGIRRLGNGEFGDIAPASKR